MEVKLDPLIPDPELFTIKQKKDFGLWPPSADNIADSIYPYVKRMRQENVKLLLVGDTLGEDAVRFLELDTVGKIKRIDILNPTNSDTIRANISETHKIELVETGEGKEYDLVFIDSENKLLDEVMKANYNSVKSHGIFCGNNHHKTYVKEALVKFRRGTKIGTPIMVSNRLCWFWIKR